MGQERVKLLVGVEDTVLRQIIGRLDRTHALAPGLVINGLDAAVRRDCCVIRPVRGHPHPSN